MNKPLIGITLDHTEEKTYAHYPWYALRDNYVRAIEKMGGVPLLLPYVDDQVERYIDILDGLVIPGGDSDINPLFYGCAERHEKVVTKDHRARFELKLLEKALAKGIPYLGICLGLQVLNVQCGGTLIQHIPEIKPSPICHKQTAPKHETTHQVSVQQNTLGARLFQASSFNVNSTHHQAIDRLGKGLVMNAQAEDGIIEGIELTNYGFCVGVQWHPEYLTTVQDQALFQAFVNAAATPLK